MTDYRHPKTACPCCGKTLNASGASGNDEGAPGEGDLSVCIYCATILVFDANMTLRLLPQAELETLPEETLIELHKMQTAIRSFNKHRMQDFA